MSEFKLSFNIVLLQMKILVVSSLYLSSLIVACLGYNLYSSDSESSSDSSRSPRLLFSGVTVEQYNELKLVNKNIQGNCLINIFPEHE